MKLNPCPNCKTDTHVYPIDVDDKASICLCKRCGISTPIYPTKQLAAKAWNEGDIDPESDDILHKPPQTET